MWQKLEAGRDRAEARVVGAEGLFIPRKVRYWLLMALEGVGGQKHHFFCNSWDFCLEQKILLW